MLANACGPCIGQWRRDDMQLGMTNTIVSSFNRNFPRRNDGNPQTLSFIGSPETVVAMALTGRLDHDFVHDPIATTDGGDVLLEAPVADELPKKGFDPGEVGVRRAGRAGIQGRRRRGGPTPIASSCSSRSPRGTATTSPACACW